MEVLPARLPGTVILVGFCAILAGRVYAFVTVHNTETNETLTGPPDALGATKPLLERIYEAFTDGSTLLQASRH